jgi:hypothetical protein
MELVDLEIVADEVQLAADTNLKETRGIGEITSGSCAVDDLVGGGLDSVVRGEFGGRGNCLGIFGGCCGAALGVVDGSPAARRGGALMEIFSGTLRILMKVAACTLGVVMDARPPEKLKVSKGSN